MITAGNDNAIVAQRHLADLGLRISYGQHVDERDRYDSSSIASRVADLHTAYADPSVDALLTVIGGFNSNELLPHLDFDLIGDNPKILCGYSDITALQNAITATRGSSRTPGRTGRPSGCATSVSALVSGSVRPS